jgi:uroporphyrinogen decarboxylase
VSDQQPTPRERFIRALERKPIAGRVPHFELVFFLTMEAFGKVHPSQRHYGQWDQMQESEQELHREEMADLYIRTAQTYEHDAIFLHPNPGGLDETKRLIELVRTRCDRPYFLMMHGDPTFGVPNGDEMLEFSYRMVDEPQGLMDEAQRGVERSLEWSAKLTEQGELDGFALCSDYCMNVGPFLSPEQFSVFVTPYLKQVIAGYREMGYYTIKHTDGNMMPIIDQLVDSNPHALHSIDPQAGVDIAEVKRLYGDRVCLIGNVNCGLLDTGTEEEVIQSARYALRSGMPGYGYVFSTSNCVYTGMRLSRYELMLDVWRKEGNY